jgi:D-alanine-D-alanine ligase
MRELAVSIYKLTGCCGLARVDFLVDAEKIFVNEVNTMPGLTQTGPFALLVEHSGMTYTAMLDRLLSLALDRYEARSRHRF